MKRFPSLFHFACVRVSRLWADRRGTSSVEYGLILAFIVLMMFGALQGLAGVTKNLWTDISTRVSEAG